MLEFEKPIIELEMKISALQTGSSSSVVNLSEEIVRLQGKIDRLLRQAYAKLTPAQKVQVARHENRPHLTDYLAELITDFTPLSGDRLFGDDQALLGGLGRFRGTPCVILGHEKGRDLQTRLKHNFGMARPEGYRKAQRLMRMAEQFDLPIISLVDTAGAYPGVDAEARGQAEAIAKSIEVCLQVKTPIVSVIMGEGGSGGAIAIATADRVFMLEHSVYSVISPEGCASILWRSATFSADAAAALKLTAQDMMTLRLIDGIIEEPVGGAHRDPMATMARVGDQIEKSIRELRKYGPDQLRANRRKKFLDMGRNLPSHEEGWFF